MIKRNIIQLMIITFSIIMFACSNDVPEPNVKIKVIEQHNRHETIQAVAQQVLKQADNDFTVKYHISGKQAYIECLIKNFTFLGNDTEKRTGQINVYVNGVKLKSVRSATFILKDLPEGTNEVKLEVVNMDGQPYGMEQKFIVII